MPENWTQHRVNSQHVRYETHTARIANALRDLAERVEREGKVRPTDYDGNESPHVYRAANVVHELAWGFANLNADVLLNAALDADAALREHVREITTPEGNRVVVDGKPYGLVEISDAGWRETGHEGDTGLRMGGTPGVRPARTEPVYRLIPLTRPED